jgi:uncharacterized protein
MKNGFAPSTIAAIGDLHVHAQGPSYAELFKEISTVADALLLCGDLTNVGLPEEAEHLASDIARVEIPVMGVLGNHDHESGQPETITRILSEAGMHSLESQVHEVAGIGFVGAKGFGGGFGKYMLGFFGEPATKAFARESTNEARQLENKLHELSHVDRVVVALHYAPIFATLEGEPREIWPYLGSSHLEETIDRFDNVQGIFHGHAHHGIERGMTGKNIPVFNCALPVAKESGRPYSLLRL